MSIKLSAVSVVPPISTPLRVNTYRLAPVTLAQETVTLLLFFANAVGCPGTAGPVGVGGVGGTGGVGVGGVGVTGAAAVCN